jgi:uncharacterized membrane protein
LGEAGCIYAEMFAAKGQPYLAFILGIVPWMLLCYGYYVGYKSGSIWQITAVSIGAIVIAEPIIILLTIGDKPNKFAIIGCILAVIGMVVGNVKD